MLNNVIKATFAFIGAITGYTLTRTLFLSPQIDLNQGMETVIYVAVSLVLAVLFYSVSHKFLERTLEVLDQLEARVRNMTLYELMISAVGLIAGLIIANLIAIPIIKVDIIGVPLSIIANIFFGCAGIAVATWKKNEHIFEQMMNKGGQGKGVNPENSPKILDTSVIIDGRVIDILRSGFIEGELVVPSFVLEELRHIADSQDVLKRNRGRRGLDVLNSIQKEMKQPIRIETIEIAEGTEVDDALLVTAKKMHGQVLTIDYNLNKVAKLQGVPVLNINELANAVKPIALPGEDMMVQVIKDGKENGQGIGYLDDGTMIVVEGGRRFIGENLNVTVTSVLQTAAGRMIFAKPKCSMERVI